MLIIVIMHLIAPILSGVPQFLLLRIPGKEPALLLLPLDLGGFHLRACADRDAMTLNGTVCSIIRGVTKLSDLIQEGGVATAGKVVPPDGHDLSAEPLSPAPNQTTIVV
jgi:hypothetical protein